MAEYAKAVLREKVSRFGEVFIVLDSGVEYECHGTEQLEFRNAKNGVFEEVRVEGLRDDEWVIVEFPLDSIEHVYTHREI